MRGWLVAPLVVGLVGFVGQMGCAKGPLPPLGEIIVYVDTDAPVPPGGGRAPGLTDPAPLFDTLRFDTYEPGASAPCKGCSREFDVDKDKFTSQRVSIGVPARPGTPGYRLRVSLYLHDWLVPCFTLTSDQQSIYADCTNANALVPHPLATISRTLALPVTQEGVLQEVHTFLATEAVGIPDGAIDEPVDVEPGKPPSSQASTWAGGVRHDCTTSARPGEACVPSGAFWSGNPRAIVFKSTFNIAAYPTPRLLVVSPFFMKTTEVTVAECLAQPAACGDPTAKANFGGLCTINPRWATTVPINCTTAPTRDAFCTAWGGTVASAAQLEYVGRGLVGSTFVWGNDLPSCEDAMWGRANYNELGPCYTQKQGGGPYPTGLGARDRLVLPTGTIVDVAGNIQEHTSDRLGDACKCQWGAGVLHDPVCKDPSDGYSGVVGGLWASGPAGMALGEIGCYPVDFASADVGFRCSRPGN
jgi:formylglycine-generating enzyme required for sulfatase activity